MSKKMKYEVRWMEYYTVDHLNGEWDDCCEKFKRKLDAIIKARWLDKLGGVRSIRVLKIIDWEDLTLISKKESNEQEI